MNFEKQIRIDRVNAFEFVVFLFLECSVDIVIFMLVASISVDAKHKTTHLSIWPVCSPAALDTMSVSHAWEKQAHC